MDNVPIQKLLEVILPERIDIAIRYLAVDFWENKMEFYLPYCKMQINKLWEKFEPLPLSIPKQLNRFLRNINNYKRGIVEPIKVGNDYGLIDGSHRLSIYMYFNVKDISISIEDRNGKYGCKSYYDQIFRLFTEEEKDRIELTRTSLLNDLEAGRWK